MTSFTSLGKCKSEREKKNPKEILISNARYHFDFWQKTLKENGMLLFYMLAALLVYGDFIPSSATPFYK